MKVRVTWRRGFPGRWTQATGQAAFPPRPGMMLSIKTPRGTRYTPPVREMRANGFFECLDGSVWHVEVLDRLVLAALANGAKA